MNVTSPSSLDVAPRSSLKLRYLDPASSLSEVLFGLIMTLTFTLGAGIIIEDEGREGARQLLIALIGCNIAWGVIDAALYITGILFDRGRLKRLAHAVNEAPDERSAVTLIGSELDELLENVTDTSDREALYGRIAGNLRTRAGEDMPVQIGKADLLGAFTSFWLVVLASAPAAVPFLIFDDAYLALRISNAVLLGILFATGYWWARYTLGKPWIVGFGFLLGGLILVAIAIALGG
jgi:hypothetical protein